MRATVLLLDPDDERRFALVKRLSDYAVVVVDAGDPAIAMAALGRAQFDALVTWELGGTLSLRGLCLLARKRHPRLQILMISNDPARAPALQVGERVLDAAGSTMARLAKAVVDAVNTPVNNPFDVPTTTVVWETLEQAAQEKRGGPVEPPAPQIPVVPSFAPPIARAPVAPPPPLRPGSMPMPRMAQFAHTPTPGPAPTPQPVMPLHSTVVVPGPAQPLVGPPATVAARPSAGAAAAAAPALQQTVLAPAPVPAAMPPPLVPAPAASWPAFSVPSEDDCSLVGDLADLPGPSLAMAILAQQLTGVLHILSGDAGGVVYFYRGDPVFAAKPEGDRAVFGRLLAGSLLHPDFPWPGAPEGMLVPHLVEGGYLRAEVAKDVVLGAVREGVANLLWQRAGEYRFREDESFIESTPLVKVNAFGMVMEGIRQRMKPGDLTELVGRNAHMMVLPGTALAAASARIRPFTRGVDLAPILTQRRTVTEVLRSIGLDAVQSGLLLQALVEARLVLLRRPEIQAPPPTLLVEMPTDPRRSAVSGHGFDIPDTVISTEMGSLSNEMQAARQLILGTYFRVKSLKAPHEVLGTAANAPRPVREAALKQWMARLDAMEIPAGPGADELKTNLEELRWKLTQAFVAMDR